MSSKHPDHVNFGTMPIPVLLWMRHNKLEHARRNPGEEKRAMFKRWSTVLLSAMLRQCRPVEVCSDCGCAFDRHESYCPGEVAA